MIKKSVNDSISLAKLDSILLYEPEEMVVSVEAGITLSVLENTLAQKGQWVPTLLATENPDRTLGAAINNDLYHPRSSSMGMLRTSILGGMFCTTNGELFKSGSRVVKSVAGYDIHRAFCGSKGRFGAIIALTLKVQPRPEIFFRFTTSTENRTDLAGYSPTICEAIDNKVVVELTGYKEDIDEDVRLLKEARLIENELTDIEWIETLSRIRTNKTATEATTDDLLSKVRTVFDPKGILTS